jgi:NADPH:quinone reductase-like Zn-dependent oxidoreductase
MPNAVVMTGYGPPEVLKWTGVPLAEPGEGQIRIKVKAAGISPTDLALRAGYLKAIPLGATPVRYGAGVAGRVRALGPVDAVFDAAGQGVLADAIALARGPKRVITLSDPAAADFGVTLSEPTPGRAPDALDETIALLADGRLRLRAHKSMPMQQAAEAHRQLESGNVHQRIILTLNERGRHSGGQASRS